MKLVFTASSINSMAISRTIRFFRLRKMPDDADREQNRAQDQVMGKRNHSGLPLQPSFLFFLGRHRHHPHTVVHLDPICCDGLTPWFPCDDAASMPRQRPSPPAAPREASSKG